MQTASNNNDSRPYLSVVVTARNDDHGGNLLGRMQTFVNGLLAQARRHAVPLELIVVDWNPPSDKPALIDALRWPDDLGPVQVRFIEVPPSLHNTFRHGRVLPLYQMIAKNAGIRRARGQFVLATNIDVLFSHELFEFFAQQRLEAGRMYRIDRHDAMQDAPVDAPIDEQLHYCETHLIRINTRLGTFPVSATGKRAIEPGDILSAESGISLGLGWYPLEGGADEKFRWVLNDAEIFLESRNGDDALLIDLEPGPGVGFLPFFLRVSGPDDETLQEVVVTQRQRVRIQLPASPQGTQIRLHLPGGGLEAARDPRILNFRVFALQWERAGASAAESLPPPSETQSAPTTVSPAAPPPRPSLPRRLWRVFSQLRSAEAPVQVALPIPAFVVRRFRPQLQGSALVLTVDPAWRRRSRGASGRKATRRVPDIVPEGLELLWGKGWHIQEYFKGEWFRWAQNNAELILHTPLYGPAVLRLLVEPGPALGDGPFHLRVRNGQGKTVGTATVTRRQWIDLPLPGDPGRTQVFRLEARGDSPPRVLPNDPRELYFRVLRCRLALQEFSPPHSPPSQSDRPDTTMTPLPHAPGVLLGHGWRAEMTAPNELAWRADAEAEILVRRAGVPTGRLLLEIETPDGIAAELLLREDPKPAVRHSLNGRSQILIPVDLEEEQTGILRVTAVEPGRPATAPRALRLVRAAWLADGATEQAASAAADSGARSPAFLHTNACGDFTLLARRHWFDLRGYPEFDLFSMNLDSVFCFAAHHGGAPETMLSDPMRIYHIEHATGSGFTPEGQARLFERIAAKGMSWMDYDQVLDLATQMKRLGTAMIFNGQDWGFARVELAERTVPSQTSHAHARASKHTTQGL